MMNTDITDVYIGTVEDPTWTLEVEEPDGWTRDPITLTHTASGREYVLHPDGTIEETTPEQA